jgi:hypothetical protein
MLSSWKANSFGEYLVAVKSAKVDSKHPDAAEDLAREAAVMAAVGSHENVVSLIGVRQAILRFSWILFLLRRKWIEI